MRGCCRCRTNTRGVHLDSHNLVATPPGDPLLVSDASERRCMQLNPSNVQLASGNSGLHRPIIGHDSRLEEGSKSFIEGPEGLARMEIANKYLILF